MFMLSRQADETVNVVFGIESSAKARSQKHNFTTRKEMKMPKNIHLLLLS